jgi:hypothetical protein
MHFTLKNYFVVCEAIPVDVTALVSSRYVMLAALLRVHRNK